MRVLFSSTSGFGHIFPMLPLACALADAGHDVLWATGPEAASVVGSAGLATAPSGLGGPALRGARGRLHAVAATMAPRERAAYLFPEMFAATFAPPMLDDLLPIARSFEPDLLVHEHGEMASPLVGALLDRPSVTHSFGGGIPEVIVDSASAVLAPLWEQHGLAAPPHAGCYESALLDICPPSVQSVPLDHVGDILPLRPVAATGRDVDSRAETLPDVGDAAPLVYLTLGTVQNHLPVLRTAVDAVAALPVRLLVAVGRDGDPAALGPQPAHVQVERWVDQPRVLETCAVVVSHAGSGTFLGALAQGVPQLCLPQAADQFRNVAGGLRAGAVLSLDPSEAEPASISGAVTRLLTEDSFRRGAEAVAQEIREMPAPAEVAGDLARQFGR